MEGGPRPNWERVALERGGAWARVAAIAAAGAFVLAASIGEGEASAATSRAIAVALLAFPGALLVRTIAAIWRGPPLAPFPLEAAALCSDWDAEKVRQAAQLRGTMGGAGHVHPARLAIPAAAWAAALGAVASALLGSSLALEAAWALAAVGSAIAAAIHPARAFWYREVAGGAILVHPPEAVSILSRAPVRRRARSTVAVRPGEG